MSNLAHLKLTFKIKTELSTLTIIAVLPILDNLSPIFGNLATSGDKFRECTRKFIRKSLKKPISLNFSPGVSKF